MKLSISLPLMTIPKGWNGRWHGSAVTEGENMKKYTNICSLSAMKKCWLLQVFANVFDDKGFSPSVGYADSSLFRGSLRENDTSLSINQQQP